MAEEGGRERRRAERLERSWHVFYRKPEHAHGVWSLARIRNLNATGVAFLTDELLDVKQRLELKFDLEHTPLHRVNGLIVWRAEMRPDEPPRFEYGVAFTGLSQEDGDALAEFATKLPR
ncbi:MAG TPA: PilZ domain-containing protein [bacterium]